MFSVQLFHKRSGGCYVPGNQGSGELSQGHIDGPFITLLNFHDFLKASDKSRSLLGRFAQEFLERGRARAFHFRESVKTGFFFAERETSLMGMVTEFREFMFKSMGCGPEPLMAAQGILKLGVRVLKRLEAKSQFFIPGCDLLGETA